MQLLQSPQPDPQSRQWQLIATIQSVMSQICDSIQFQSWLPSQQEHQKIHLTTKITIKQLVQQIKLLWQFKLLNHVMIIKVCLLQQQQISLYIKTLCRKQRQKVIYYFNHVNNITFGENQGEFYVHGSSKIVYQYREDNWYGLKSLARLRAYLTKKLRKINQLMRKNVEGFLIKFKLIHNVEVEKEQLEKVQTLIQLKLFFQQNKKTPHYPPQLHQNMLKWRRHASQVDFTKVQKFDRQLLTLIEGKFPQKYPPQTQSSTTQNFIEELKYNFKSKSSAYNNFSEYNSHIMYPLVIAMEVLQVKNETPLKEKGGYGKVTRGLYSCKYGKTVYDGINKELQSSQNYFSQQIFNRYLCKKSSLQQTCPAFQNQKQALMKLRNKKSPHIAQYYCNISRSKPFDDNNIYMDVYASNVDDIPIKMKHKFKILMEVIKGLSFLNVNGILHRDIKPENVVVDRQMNSKIIDFGSCGSVHQKEELFRPYDTKLRSTAGYFVKYQEYLQTVPSHSLGKEDKMWSRQQFYQHYFFDIYSFGKVIEKLFNLPYYEFVNEDLLMSQVYYLKEKCCEVNPADRLAHEEVQFFLEMLIKLEGSSIGG